MIEVRASRISDQSAVDNLIRRAFAEHRSVYIPTPEARARASSDAGTFSRVVAADHRSGAIVGTLMYRVEANRMHVRGLAVDPSRRRQGIASALIESVVAKARLANLRAVSLFTVLESGNVPIFERLGFHAVNHSIDESTTLVHGGAHATAVYMERANDCS